MSLFLIPVVPISEPPFPLTAVVVVFAKLSSFAHDMVDDIKQLFEPIRS